MHILFYTFTTQEQLAPCRGSATKDILYLDPYPPNLENKYILGYGLTCGEYIVYRPYICLRSHMLPSGRNISGLISCYIGNGSLC